MVDLIRVHMDWALVKFTGAAGAKTTTPASCSPARARRPPNCASRRPSAFDAVRSGDNVEAVHERQHDREEHASFDR